MKVIYGIFVTISLVLLAIAPRFEGWQQAMLISFSVNILTSIIIIVFVNRTLEKQALKIKINEEKKAERQAILNANKLIECLLPIYILEFNQLTIPIEKRTKGHQFCEIDCKNFNDDYKVSDLVDMFALDITVYGSLNSSILESFDMINKKIVNTFEAMLTKCNFKYYSAVEIAINNVIKTSLQPNAISTLNFLRNDKKALPTLEEMMKKYDGNPDEDIEKYSGNLFMNPLILYKYLRAMKCSIENYHQAIQTVIKDDNYEI